MLASHLRKVGAATALAASILAANQAYGLEWYVAQYNGLGGNTNDAHQLMASGAPVASGYYKLIDFTDPQGAGGPSNFGLDKLIPGNTGNDDNNYSLVASGVLHVQQSGTYIFRSSADDGSKISLAGRNIVSTGGACCGNFNSVSFTLTEGQSLFIGYNYSEGGGGSHGELSVSSDGGASFQLLGSGTDGAFTAHPAFTVDQSIPLLARAGDGIIGDAGLKGQYFQATYNNQNAASDAFFAGNPTPTGTFLATNPNYHGGGNLNGHLGADAASLTAGGTNGTDNATITLSGAILILDQDDFDLNAEGIQVAFRLDADDNARLSIGGMSLIENDGGHGTGHFHNDNTNTLLDATGDNAVGTRVLTFPEAGYYAFDAFYHNGGGGIDFQVLSSIGASGAAFPLVGLPADRLVQSAITIPEPASLSLLALGGLAMLRRRNRVA